MFKGLGKGAIALIISGVVCKFFGALFRLPLTTILGIKGIGVFQMVMSLYSLALVFVTGGVTASLSKLVSSARARGELGKISNYFKLSSMLTVSVALIIGFAFFLFSKNICLVQGAIEGELSYKLFLILIPVGAFIGVLRGVIQGYENMVPTAISQILEQVFKLSLGLLFAYFLGKKSEASGVFGGFLGITLSEVIAFAYLIIYSLRHLSIQGEIKGNFPVLISAIVPLSLGGAIIPFTHAFDSLIIVSRLGRAGYSKTLATSLYGLQTGVVGSVLNIPLIISLSLAMTILPKISYLESKNDVEGQKSLIANSFTAMWTAVLPLAFGIAAISKDIYKIIFPSIGNLLDVAADLTTIGALSVILTAIMQFLSSVLQARGHYLFSFTSTLFGGIAKILLVWLLSANQAVNIYAIPISNIVLALIVCISCLIKLGSLIKLSAFCVFTPLFSSFIMFLIVKLFARIHLSSLLIVGLSAAIGAIVYVIFAMPILKKIYNIFVSKKG